MQRTTGFEQLTDADLIRGAQWGAPWVREQLAAAYQPLVQALAARALEGRAGAEGAVRGVVRETLGRVEYGLGGVVSAEGLRPWIVAVAVESTLAHAAAVQVHPGVAAASGGGFAEALPWLDVEDALMAALWSLEQEGCLSRFETAAALSWSPYDTEMRMDAVRGRVDAARSVTAALTREPRCPVLDREAAAWDGRPGALWRDQLARHTLQCGPCATGGFTGAPAHGLSAGPIGVPTTHGAADAANIGDTVNASSAGYAAYSVGTPDALDVTEAFVLVPQDVDSFAHAERGAGGVAAGARGTRAARRRRKQADDRTRRRAAVAAGIAVAAVTAGAFSLQSGSDGEDRLEANRAAAPDLDLPLANEPGTLTASPSTTSASPSASASASATATPGAPKKATPSKSARPTTAPATRRPTTPAATKPAPSKSAKPTGGTDTGSGGGGGQDTGQSSAADQVIALVNAERAKAGCGPLTANATLTKAAQGHSDDMAARDFFDHTNPDGKGPGDRVTAAGYPWSTYGENIAMGQQTPEQVMDAWMNSSGHRANILNCDFKEIGVGIHSSGGPYWTQVFGAR
ncbi:CAP domain-containing protein [Streptomyces sp. NPDC093089]|uniref:CAP domain-containing protein n=1 Tax=Streptomyces sp. NPDC093089 TaxID=3366024 RepID=UPI00381CB823